MKVLAVSVDVHLDDAVLEGLVDFFEGATRTTVEDEVQWVGFEFKLAGNSFLAVVEDTWLENNVAWLVNAVYVTEGSGQHKDAEFIQGVVGVNHVFGGGVELVFADTAGVVTVFFTANNADFNFEDDVELFALSSVLTAYLEVFFHAQFRTVEHVALEQAALASSNALAACFEQWDP